jgi:hypothetical protein
VQAHVIYLLIQVERVEQAALVVLVAQMLQAWAELHLTEEMEEMERTGLVMPIM